MKTKEKEASYRVLSQVRFPDQDDNMICINAGESLPPEVLENAELIKLLLEQEKICRVGKNDENILEQEKDEFGREIYSDDFIYHLLNPQGIANGRVQTFLNLHNLCEKNLLLLREKIFEIKKQNPQNSIFDCLLPIIERQWLGLV